MNIENAQRPPRELHVSDHMLLRYMERMLGVDFEDFRRSLHGKLLPYVKAGVSSAEVEGMVVKFRYNGGSAAAVTMWPVGSVPKKQTPPRGNRPPREGRLIEIRKRMHK